MIFGVFDRASASKPAGKAANGLTTVCTEQTCFSMGVVSSRAAIERQISQRSPFLSSKLSLTVLPNSSSRAHNFSLVFFVVDDRPQAQTHHGERWHIFWCIRVAIFERIDMLRRAHSDFKLAPRDLLKQISMSGRQSSKEG